MFRVISLRTTRTINLSGIQQIAKLSNKETCEKPQIAVVLSGCGVYDGSEIHESAHMLSQISRNGGLPHIFAPQVKQMHTINHLTGEEDSSSPRHVYNESARIARGNIKPLSELVQNYKNFHAVVFPGGFGVAKNLSNFAFKGTNCTILPEIVTLIQNCHKAKISLGFVCIAPILAARVLCSPTITLGKESPAEDWPHKSAIEAAKKLGAIVEYKEVNELSYDRANKLYSTPAYMYDGDYHEIDDGIGNMIKFMMVNIKHGQ